AATRGAGANSRILDGAGALDAPPGRVGTRPTREPRHAADADAGARPGRDHGSPVDAAARPRHGGVAALPGSEAVPGHEPPRLAAAAGHARAHGAAVPDPGGPARVALERLARFPG